MTVPLRQRCRNDDSVSSLWSTPGWVWSPLRCVPPIYRIADPSWSTDSVPGIWCRLQSSRGSKWPPEVGPPAGYFLFWGGQSKAQSFQNLNPLAAGAEAGRKDLPFCARKSRSPPEQSLCELSSWNCAKLFDLNTGLSRDEDPGSVDSH